MSFEADTLINVWHIKECQRVPLAVTGNIELHRCGQYSCQWLACQRDFLSITGIIVCSDSKELVSPLGASISWLSGVMVLPHQCQYQHTPSKAVGSDKLSGITIESKDSFLGTTALGITVTGVHQHTSSRAVGGEKSDEHHR